jgi:hypothetical protein
MASYTITTNRTREIGLKYYYDTYADKEQFPTQQSYFQSRINIQVTDPMYAEYERANSVAFDASFDTIPETEQPAAEAEIEAVIIAHGGTIVPPGPTSPVLPPPGPPVVKEPV